MGDELRGIKPIENKADDLTKIENSKDIIYKLVMDQELDEKDGEIIDKIVEKRR